MDSTVPRNNTRAITSYLIAVVVLGLPLLVFMAADPDRAEGLVPVYMFVPAASAVIARLISKEKIVFGRPAVSTLALAFVPALVVGAVYALLSLTSLISWTGDLPGIGSVVFGIVTASILGFGEELGWRGYLLPRLRSRAGFFAANAILAGIWFAYHVPVIFIPGLYSNPGIPLWANLVLFFVAVTAFSFFVGFIWERHHDVWAPTLAHGVWNTLLQSVYVGMFLGSSAWLMGEFGIVTAVTLTLLALVVVIPVARSHRSAVSG